MEVDFLHMFSDDRTGLIFQKGSSGALFSSSTFAAKMFGITF